MTALPVPALATQTTWERTPKDQTYYVDLRRNAAGEQALREVFEELGIEENGPKDLIFGSSDIGNVSYGCPAFHPCLQIVDDAPVHTREFEKAVRSDRAHEAIITGAKLIAFQAAKIFSDKDRIRAMKADFEKK